MENEDKVFHSNITKAASNNKKHLYDLLDTTSAKPVLPLRSQKKNETWSFSPNCDKQYRPRKGSKSKVYTVAEVRSLFEKDVYNYLQDDLEKLERFLLRKIRNGSSCNDKTKKTAVKLFDADNPISKMAWQMLVNINPKNHNYPKQFVLWNGKCIQINGSKGGQSKFICNYDLKENKQSVFNNTCMLKENTIKLKKGLLRNSLNVKFKAGPLRKKKLLDDSFQKYQINPIDIIKLPKPVLQVSPAYGTILDPPISGFINNLRGETGVISQKLSEFAVAMLGTTSNETPIQLDKECCITFDLIYKCDQNRLLMRRDTVKTPLDTNVDSNFSTATDVSIDSVVNPTRDSYDNASASEINTVMHDILTSVEIGLMEDSVYYSIDEPREVVDENSVGINNNIKDKFKKKICELGKLDVTIIKLPENCQSNDTKPCTKSFCTLGCVCDSLNCMFNLKQHCGVLDCMFGCKCGVSTPKAFGLLERDNSDIIPSLMSLDNEINAHLAKEEKMFRQTVIVSGKTSILLKSRKRNSESMKKYTELHQNKERKIKDEVNKELIIHIPKLSCDNIEPYCMVHSLYKCFCKGKFTESYLTENCHNKIITHCSSQIENKMIEDKKIDGNEHERMKRVFKAINSNFSLRSQHDHMCVSARTRSYLGRKYSYEYYKTTNAKIKEMEQNDSLLKKKMMKLVDCSTKTIAQQNYSQLQEYSPTTNDSPQTQDSLQINDYPETLSSSGTLNSPEILDTSNNTIDLPNQDVDSDKRTSNSLISDNLFFNNIFESSSSLRDWLESRYKMHKIRRRLGIIKNALGAPKKGDTSLQTWEFILSRYREGKNFFFVSNQKPYRTFLARDPYHPTFANCINIDDIRFADLKKYPLTIRNLVTNSSESENSFCILRGWDHCWEICGSVVKVVEKDPEIEPVESATSNLLLIQNDSPNDKNDNWSDEHLLFSMDNSHKMEQEKNNVCTDVDDTSNVEKSKWFLMTIENDFTEIRFYKKGFFVTYDRIQRSIALARETNKTVLLLSHARIDRNCPQQYGIYAIPCKDESCVCIGPYEENEPLGIEVVKTFSNTIRHKETRGVWISTNKVDNKNVIDNPLSFLPSLSSKSEPIMTFGKGVTTVQATNNNENDETHQKLPSFCKDTVSDKKKDNIVKPIKIRRTNGFYHMSQSIKTLNNITLKSVLEKPAPSLTMTDLGPVSKEPPQKKFKFGTSGYDHQNTNMLNIPPVAEMAAGSSIKITSVYSEPNESYKNKRSSMLILKPEEINEKILANTITNNNISTDIEKTLETYKIRVTRNTHDEEILILSDGENEYEKPVWIECVSVANLGCIRGKIDSKKRLSFEFPGFNCSKFYTTSEAFDKINQVLARKIYVPNYVQLNWQVVESKDPAQKILTSQCLQKKTYLTNLLRQNRVQNRTSKSSETTNTSSNKINNNCTSEGTKSPIDLENVNFSMEDKDTFFESLENTSIQLENKCNVLMKEAYTKKDDIMNLLNEPFGD